jgi:hypothetical protein
MATKSKFIRIGDTIVNISSIMHICIKPSCYGSYNLVIKTSDTEIPLLYHSYDKAKEDLERITKELVND